MAFEFLDWIAVKLSTVLREGIGSRGSVQWRPLLKYCGGTTRTMTGGDAQQAISRCLTLARWYLDPTIMRRCAFTSTHTITCDQCKVMEVKDRGRELQLLVDEGWSVAETLRGWGQHLDKRVCSDCGHVGGTQRASAPVFSDWEDHGSRYLIVVGRSLPSGEDEVTVGGAVLACRARIVYIPGHYYALVRTHDGAWNKADDNTITTSDGLHTGREVMRLYAGAGPGRCISDARNITGRDCFVIAALQLVNAIQDWAAVVDTPVGSGPASSWPPSWPA